MEDKELELNNENLENEDIYDEEELYTSEQISQLLDEVLPKVACDTDDLQNYKLDEKKFLKGASDISYICGQFSALVNVGVDKSSAIDVIFNLQNIEFNKAINTENCKTNIETAKLQNIQIQGQQL